MNFGTALIDVRGSIFSSTVSAAVLLEAFVGSSRVGTVGREFGTAAEEGGGRRFQES